MTEYQFKFYGEKAYWENFWGQKQPVAGHIAWTTHEDDVNLNIETLIKLAKEQHTSFEKVFSEAVSHEVLHNAIDDINYLAGKTLDAICQREKHSDLKKWHGGIPWR